jgi:multimeric flavodoxin WrbA
MTKVRFTKDGQKALDFILARWAPIMRPRRQARIERIISLLMTERGVKQADQPLVLEATRMVVNKGFEPFLHMLEDPAGYARRRRAQYNDLDGYYKRPYIVTRWPSTATKPAKPPSQMKVLAVCGSPRRHGNTDVLIDEALRACQDAGAATEKIFLQSLNLKFCISCRKCKEPGWEGWCTIKDDMSQIYPKIEACDAMIVGYPIYTGRESAQMSTFFDRLDCLRGHLGQRLKPGRRAMVIATWGYPYTDTYDHSVEQVITWLNLHRIEPVEALTACGFSGLLHGWDENHKAIILRHPEEMEKVYRAAWRMITGEELKGKSSPNRKTARR